MWIIQAITALCVRQFIIIWGLVEGKQVDHIPSPNQCFKA